MLLICLAGITSRMVASIAIAERGGLLDARAGARAHVQLDLAAVDGRERSPDPGRAAGPSGNASTAVAIMAPRKIAAKRGPLLQRHAEQCDDSRSRILLEAALESLLKSRQHIPASGFALWHRAA